MKMQTIISYLFYSFPACFLSIYCTLLSCNVINPVSNTDNNSTAATIITPSVFRSGELLPIIVCVDDQPETNKEEYTLHTTSGVLTNRTGILKKGVGSITSIIEADKSITISSDEFIGKRDVALLVDQLPTYHSGTVSNSIEVWDASTDHIITGDLTIPSGTELIIKQGTRILSSGSCNIFINGSLQSSGTIEHPILFSSIDNSQPWGGIEITDGNASFEYCIFTNGGADQTRPFAHAQCQPVTFAVRSTLSIQDCFYIDNIGKALGSIESTVSVNKSLISRCATGGEFHFSFVNISDCHIIDIPNGDGVFIDNDNDGFYFYDRHPEIQAPSRVTRSFFITGKDDGIDHNDAHLSIDNCWIEGFMHEGVAASRGDTVSVFNTVIKGCEQGVEAGYGAPFVIVDHCVITDNTVGLRFGDLYETAADGHLTATNTVFFSNTDDIYTFDINPESHIENSVSVSYCLFNDNAYQVSPFCIGGTPLFDTQYHLSKQSPGFSSGTDNTPLGLLKEYE